MRLVMVRVQQARTRQRCRRVHLRVSMRRHPVFASTDTLHRNGSFNMRTSSACALGWYSSIFGWLWSLIVWTFWVIALGSGAYFLYNRFGPGHRGGQTVGGSSGNVIGDALGTIKDGVVIGGIVSACHVSDR